MFFLDLSNFIFDLLRALSNFQLFGDGNSLYRLSASQQREMFTNLFHPHVELFL